MSAEELGALGLAWARAMPVVGLVPAFGLRALPAPGRAIMAVLLAAGISPALAPAVMESGMPWWAAALREVARGVPIAVSAAVPLWAATMAGGLLDALRGSQETTNIPTVEGRATPFGTLLSLLGGAIFLATGGPSRVAMALAMRPVGTEPLHAVAANVVGGISLAVAIACPLLAAAVVVELAAALLARAASPAQVQALLAPLRALALLGLTGLMLERLATVMARSIEASP